MSRQVSDYKKVLKLLEELHKDYSKFGIGRHMETIRDDYGDLWGMTDKEMVFALTKYKSALDLDQAGVADDNYVDKIIKDAENLDKFYGEEEED